MGIDLSLIFLFFTAVALSVGYSSDVPRNYAHPLDPLSPEEIHDSAVVIRKHNNSGPWIFNRINLYEPEKSSLIFSFLKNEYPLKVPRHSFSVLLHSETYSAVEVIVNLDEHRVVSWIDLPGTLKPGTNRGDRNFAEELVKDDVGVQERCRRLGWSNMTLVAADVWPVGYIGDRRDLNPSNRLVQSYFYGKNFPEDNEYAHPFDFTAIVDMKQRKVVSIEDLPTCGDADVSCAKPVGVPRGAGNFDSDLLGGKEFLRADLKPVKIRQPNGASFSIKGNLVQWQKFQFRVGFNEREGLIIHHVGYYDNNVGTDKKSRFRTLFYRLSLSETFIPYGDPRPPYQRKGAYDMGELDIGISANELSEQYCPGENVKFFDAFINDAHGEPLRLKNAICIYEEDAGILWKHTNFRTGSSVLTRSQRLNVAMFVTVGNYDYLFTWHFYQNAQIEYEVRLTGILSTSLVAEGSTPKLHGSLVAPQVNAQYHQHVFAARIDPEIDGNLNTVGTLDVIPVPGSPYGQAFTTKMRKFQTASGSRTYGSTKTSRSWLMLSENSLNPYNKEPTSYKLVSNHLSKLVVQKDSPLYPKAEFSEYDVWVTPYQDRQLYAGGRYLNDSGLPQWTREAGKKSIEKADVVLWHIFRLDHVPRVEDYPVMPSEAGGFTLKPFNFFRENPALDVLSAKG